MARNPAFPIILRDPIFAPARRACRRAAWYESTIARWGNELGRVGSAPPRPTASFGSPAHKLERRACAQAEHRSTIGTQ
jgi:hypothetical protein